MVLEAKPRKVNNLKTSSRLLRKEFADRLKGGLSQARILVPLVLYHHVWRGAAIDPENSTSSNNAAPNRRALHLQPSTKARSAWSIGR